MKPSSHFPFSIFHYPCPAIPRRRRAFTLIEVLVVVSIIALLGTLLVMGVDHVVRSTKVSATKVDLENVHGMFDEMNAASQLSIAPNQWLWRNVPVTTPCIPNLTTPSGVLFWTIPNLTGLPQITDCFDAPVGRLTQDNPILRNGSRAVLNTQLAMRILLNFPTNKAALGKLPADRLMFPTWVFGNIAPTGIDGVFGTPDDGSDTITQVAYALNNTVTYQGTNFRCVMPHISAAATAPTPGATNTYWVPENNPIPVLLDAWNNPIIFVPASGLINVYGNVSVKAPVNIASMTVTPDANDTIAALPNQGPPVPSGGRFIPPIQSPDHRPFFVSAGPDGDLSTGDDNLYSFEK